MWPRWNGKSEIPNLMLVFTVTPSKIIKGLYEPTRESTEGFVLICLKSNILQHVCVGGGGREGAVSSQLRVAVS